MLIPPKLFIDKVDDLIKGNLNHPDLLCPIHLHPKKKT